MKSDEDEMESAVFREIHTQRSSRLQLCPVFHILPLQDLVELPRSFIPVLGPVIQRYRGSIIVVPSYSIDYFRAPYIYPRMLNHREFLGWGDDYALVSTGVGGYKEPG